MIPTHPRPRRKGPSNFPFRAAWNCLNLLLVVSLLCVSCSAAWEYSTQRYLKGFSDAITPASGSSEAKIDSILQWFSSGPARQNVDDTSPLPDRDPTQTLNYAKLLRTCGTATNAFINLADTAGLSARRLLLLDSHRLTKHVVAEVLLDKRWIIVDPSFHRILRGTDGNPLTREQLSDPAVLAAATSDIPGYDSSYTYDVTAHVRLARIPWGGRSLRAILNRLDPAWADSWALSLLLERESLEMLVASIVFALLTYSARSLLRRYGEKHLNIRSIHLTDQIRRAVILSFANALEVPHDPAQQRASGIHTPPAGTVPAPTSTII